MKINTKVFVLFVFVTNNFTTFKVEEVTYLGKLEEKLKVNDNYEHIVEHTTGEINYMSKEDIFKTEKEAFEYLKKIVSDKIKTL